MAGSHSYSVIIMQKSCVQARAVDQHSFYADPAVLLNADPDPDPGPGPA